MTALRQDAYALLERIPENKLYFIVEIMRDIERIYTDGAKREPSSDFQELEKLCRPIPDLDYDKELDDWRREKYGYADIDRYKHSD